MRIKQLFVFASLALALLALFSGCMKEEMSGNQEKYYGYVQFKLYKAASYEDTKAVVEQMKYLNDATKIMVMLQYGDKEITQTLTLNSYNSETAEYGLRSAKLQLLSGTYEVLAFTLYDRLDEELYYGGESGSFEVVPGGLSVHDVLADVTPRGKVRFILEKDFRPATKSSKKEYTFDNIEFADVTVKNTKTGVSAVFEKLPADFSIHFNEKDEVQDSFQISTCVCDTLVYLEAGEYTVESYSVFDSKKVLLETRTGGLADNSFTVEDNEIAEASVPVILQEADEYIKDYYALKEIWESLGGEDWYYIGDEWNPGSNWNFNKDVDLWGDQPGVKIHDNGRVALLSLSGFGIKGDLSPAIGQLTELVELYLGNHNENILLKNDPTVTFGINSSNRMDRHKEYLRMTKTLTQFSEPIAFGMKEHGISIPEIALYETMKEEDIIDKATGSMRITPKDVLPGISTNGLKSIPKEIGNLTKLETFFIANSVLTELPDEMENLTALTDFELYNCPEMKQFPMVLSRIPGLISINLSANPQWIDVDEGLKALATGAAAKEIQIIYMNECSLTKLPKELNNMSKIGLMSVASNKIKEIEAAYPDISFTQLYLDDNQLTSIPDTLTADGKRLFFKIEDVETFSCTYNKLTKVPDIFHAESLYGIASVDFSYNDISGFENDGNGYQGIYVETFSLTNNPKLKVYPKCLAASGSKISYLNLRACGIEEIPEKSFVGKHTKDLVSLDLSYNKLDDLPEEFHAVNMPYFFGIDLSYNRFSRFPFEPFDSAYLTTMGMRGQRNAKGERCLKEWPQNMYMHTGLRAMYLGSNDLRKIEDTISRNIYMLDISDNPNIVFGASDICYYWQVGAYILLYDKTQQIRNCGAMLD